ncbi:dethiobiotin synthase [Methylocapsa aurea]|uniref:dethiobiotin synthase n=1 Tax=Methylocapsa aurea TaxID=663610 RepID=UPI00056005D6|nr:dethiobiotin synthase [Methylocapsa aurea]
MPAIFITGAGTDVGKTYVAAGLVRLLRRRGQPVDALKPVVSGFNPGSPSGSDPAILLDALGRAMTEEEFARISPWRFRAPLSPDMAAQAEGRAIAFQELIDFCQAAIARTDGLLLIEGVGGLMVPLDDRHTVLDLMVGLGLPLIFVGGSYLGAISHILTGLDALLRRNLDVRAIVISETPGSSVALGAIATTLAHFTQAPLLTLPHQSPAAQGGEVFEQLAELL